MYIEHIERLSKELVHVGWVGTSIDEDKILSAVSNKFGGRWELVDFKTCDEDDEEGVNTAFIKLSGGNMTGTELTNEDLNELENAQIAAVGGKTTAEELPPVPRVQATDEEVDRVVESAEAELEATEYVEVATVMRNGKVVGTVTQKRRVARVTKPEGEKKVKKPEGEKKVKKIDVARKVFASNPKQERKVVIGKIMEKTGLSKVAASTYYQICKSEV